MALAALMIKRQPNFTSDEVEMLLNQVQENSDMLLGKCNGVSVSAAAKNTVWQAVATAVSSVSGVERSAREVKKKWSCLKYAAKANASVLRKEGQLTGACPKTSHQLRAVTELMGDVTVNGIATGIDTCDIIFSKPGKYMAV